MSGFVYAVECGGRIKLGFSKDPEKRFNKIASDAPFPCQLLGYWEGSRADELDVQDKFQELRVHGEWFASTEALLAFVAAHAQPVETKRKHKEIHPDDSALTAWRKRAGKTQRELADELGICTSQVNHIENGRFGASLNVALKILAMTGGEVPLDSLVREAR